MGQDSSQIDGKSHNADGVTIKPDPEEKENENLRDVSTWAGSAAKEGSLTKGSMKAPEGRKKKRRKRRSSSFSKSTYESAKDRVESQAVAESISTPNNSQWTQETDKTNGVSATPSSVSKNPKMTEVEAKKRRLLAAVSAAAGNIDSPYSDAESGRPVLSEFNEGEQDGRDETNRASQPSTSAKPTKKLNKSTLIANSAIVGKVNGRWTPEANQGTEVSSARKKVKNKKSKSRLISTSSAADDEDQRATELHLPTPNASSQAHGQQLIEDPFTGPIKDSQIDRKKRRSNGGDKGSALRPKQQKASLDKPYANESTSDGDIAGNIPLSHDHQFARNSYGSHRSISLPAKQVNMTYARTQSLDQNMDLIDPALRDTGNEQDQQIGIYKDVAMPQTTGKRKRRLPVNEDSFEQTSNCEPKTKKPRKESLKPKTPNTNGRKYAASEFREESPDLDASSSKPKRRQSSRKKRKTHEPTTKGKFTGEELDIINNEMLKYLEMNDIAAFDLNLIIQDTPSKVSQLWDEMCEALPDRPRHAIVKVCRRKFHNFGVRGKWTKEEDQQLKETYERLPKRWKEIGQVLNRHHEDVRDRWRNYVVCGETMKRQPWTEEEENHLRAVVAECIQAVRELMAAEIARNPSLVPDPRPEIEFVDWQIVSEKLGRTRSRLQCLDKWNRVTRLENSEDDSKELELGPRSWRVKMANKDVKYMRRGDYLELLTALQSSHAGREGKVNWGKLGDLDLRTKWTCMARKVAWKKLRASIPGNEQMKFQDIVTLLLNNLPENDAELDGADGEINISPEILLESDQPSPQRRPLSEAISSDDESSNGRPVLIGGRRRFDDENDNHDDNIDPYLNELDEGDFDPDDIPEHSSALNRDMLREVIDEAYFDSVDTDRENEDNDGDMAVGDLESVDLDAPSQQKGAKSKISRLRSPISFKVALDQLEPEYIDSSTHSDEEDVDMDIPARRPISPFRRESVDLDMD